VFRGSAEDVLDRYYQAATAADAQIVVRITADCPLVDAGLVAEIVEPMRVPGGVDYVSNVFPRRTYPRGLDAEALRIGVLRRLWMTAREPEAREHVTLTVHRDALRYRIRSVTSPTDHSHLRWTVDTADDLRLVRAVFEHFGHNRMDWSDVVRAFDGNPQWCGLNKHVVQKVA
jgi:spore coat polysaccharide biosynthesis protein SpsF